PAPGAPSAPQTAGWPWERIGYWGYLVHLCTVFGIALSNVVLGLTLLVAPRALRGRWLPWRRVEPVAPPLAPYLPFLGAPVALSYEPRVSVASLSELLSFATLYLAPLLVRGERDVRRVVDLLTAAIAGMAIEGLAQFFSGYGGIENRIRGP